MSFFDALFGLVFGRRGPRKTASPPTPPPTRPAAPPPPAAPPATPSAPPPPVADTYLSTLRVQNAGSLRRSDFEAVAARVGCEWEAVAAVAEVESGPLGGFAPDGRAIILFERHKFSRKTNRQFDIDHPDLSNQHPGGYPRTQAERWDQLTRAYALAPEAALESASYGRFQILGENYATLGLSVRDYVAKMARSERDQLECFEAYVRANGLVDELQRKDWAGFARRYNGPDYAANRYDSKMAEAYQRMKSNPGSVA